MRFVPLALLSLLAVTLPDGAAWAATYHVTPATIAAALDRLKPGDAVVLADGQYAALMLDGVTGSDAAPVTIAAANERRAFLRARGSVRR